MSRLILCMSTLLLLAACSPAAALEQTAATTPTGAEVADVASLDAFCAVSGGIGGSGDMARHNNGSAEANSRA